MRQNRSKTHRSKSKFSRLLLLAVLISILIPKIQVKGNELADAPYVLSFDLDRPQPSDYEIIKDVYFDYWKTQPCNPVYDEKSGGLKAFKVEFKLYVDGKEYQREYMSYDPSTYTWNGQITFENILVPSSNVVPKYYTDENSNNIKPYLLSYEIFIESSADEVIVNIPQLESNNNKYVITENHSISESADGGYSLSLTLIRPEISDQGSIYPSYINYWEDQPINYVYDENTQSIKDFKVWYVLVDENGDRLRDEDGDSIYQTMLYSADTSSWTGTVSFENIKIPYEQVEVEYYTKTDGSFIDPFLRVYDIQLIESEGKMILKVPRLKPTTVAEPSGDEKVLIINNLKSAANVIPVDIYVDGNIGNDISSDPDHGSFDNPYKTLRGAIEKARDYQDLPNSQVNIYIKGTSDISGEITLDGVNAVVRRSPGFREYLFRVGPGQEASLCNITIDGNPEDQDKDKNVAYYSLVKVDGGTLNIGPGTILRNNKTVKKGLINIPYGGAISAIDGEVNMTGGVIEGNSSTNGGGVYLSNSIMHFSGGVIQNNISELQDTIVMDGDGVPRIKYFSSGAGILAVNNSAIYMTDQAQILSNHAAEVGGGISLGMVDEQSDSQLVMTGGTIDGNTAGASGGGIFIQAECEARINGGCITNNEMTGTGQSNQTFGGGGIYVNGTGDGTYNGQTYDSFVSGILYLNNAVINGNKNADRSTLDMGAGYAACPISKTKIYVTNGVAIFNNFTSHPGKDLFVYCNHNVGSNNEDGYGKHAGNPEYHLAKRMLGGVPNNWMKEDGSPLEEEKYDGILTEHNSALILFTPNRGSELTDKLSRVTISNNCSATVGAGIGSNGTVIFGEEGTTEVSVTKKWVDNVNADGMRPDSITVNLLVEVDGQNYVMDSAVLNESNNWTYTFKDLPTKNGDEPFVYSVEEVSVAGYTGEISGDQETGFIITNSIPSEPTQPTEPTESKPSTPPPPSVTVSSPIVFKKITGGQPETTDLFTFRIEPVSYKPDQTYPRTEPNSPPLPQGEQGTVQEVKISGEGTASTGQITYKQPGYYEYKIQEIATADGKYIYSTDVYTFVDHVYMQDGQLAVDRTMYKNGQKANTTTAYFTNQYQGEPVPKDQITSLPATGEKDLLGWSLSLTLAGLGCLVLIQKKRLG